MDHSNIDDDWRCWKDLFLAAVKDYIPLKKLKGHNPVPWIDGNILNLIKKKNSVRQKLKSHPSTGLREKFKTLRAKVKKLLRESRKHFYDSIDTGSKSNPKRLWSILKLNSKSHHIPDLVSIATAPETAADQPHNPSRESADSPGIADLSAGLVFKEAKCKAQRITRKTKPIISTYKLNNTLLGTYAAEKDLGV